MNAILKEILNESAPYTKHGEVASYIPELSKADPRDLGMCVLSDTGELFGAGDYEKEFTAQSIIKPIILLAALCDSGFEKVRELVGVESTGKPFDSFNYSDLALTGDHINPMVNTGAIALCTLISGANCSEKFTRLLSIVRNLASNQAIDLDEETYISESQTGNKNRALAYLLKAYGLIDGSPDDVVDLYFRACSIRLCCRDLAKIASVFAHHGKNLNTGEVLFENNFAKYINAMLTICGMYDGSGEFALNVGIPAKSGVGGGIMAVVPGRMGIGVYSPALDKKGNSVAGIRALELLSRRLSLGIF